MSSFYATDFWAKETPQVAHNYPALFHAITAFGSIHNGYLSDTTPWHMPRGGTNQHVEFGLREFNKAIKSMSLLITHQKLSVQDQKVILTICILFVGLSSLQGLQLQAFMHLKNGLNMIHHWHLIDQPNPSEEQYGLKKVILPFIQLDSQIRPYLAGQESLLQWIDHDITATALSPRPFRDLFDAYFDLETFFNKLLRLDFKIYSFTELLQQIELLNNYADMWDASFTQLMSSLSPTASEMDALDFIHIRRQFTRAILACMVIDPKENVADTLFPYYETIIDVAARIIERGNASKSPYVEQQYEPFKHPEFFLSATIIEPLFFTATRCREPTLRRQAWRLLQLCPRREGICEGMMAFRMAELMINVEEQECSRFVNWQEKNIPVIQNDRVTAPQKMWLREPSYWPVDSNFKTASTCKHTDTNRHEQSINESKLLTKSQATERARSKCSEEGKWICERHRVVESRFLLHSERQIKFVIWTTEDLELKGKGRQFILSWW